MRLFDQPSRFTYEGATPDLSGAEIQPTGYQGSKPGALSALGNIFSGISAPFVGNFEYALKQQQLNMQKEQADMEFQKYISKKSSVDPLALAILGNIDPGLASQYAGITAPSSKPTGSTPVIPPRSPIDSSSLQGGFAPKSIDMGAVNFESLDFDSQKEAMKKKAGAQESLKSKSRFVKRLSESYSEIQDYFPKSGESNLGGLVQRVLAGGFEKTGQLPKTTAFLNRIEVLANQQARTIEGGRITDQDRKIYSNAMANAVKFPTETNINLVSDALLDLRDSGGDIASVIKDLSDTNVPLFDGIVKEVLSQLSEDEIKGLIDE